jgi:hypothetical protein
VGIIQDLHPHFTGGNFQDVETCDAQGVAQRVPIDVIIVDIWKFRTKYSPENA